VTKNILMLAAFFPVALSGCNDRQPSRPRLAGDIIFLTLGERKLRVEVASDNYTRQKGLMHRRPEDLGEDHGMLFIFPDYKQQSFWMKNTLIPLSIAFLDDDGKILQIEDMKPKDESSTRSKNKVRYALEVHQGWFRKAGLEVGDSLPDFRDKVRGFEVR
jgi:uncharacterized membrane protein (UPF0127 family)